MYKYVYTGILYIPKIHTINAAPWSEWLIIIIPQLTAGVVGAQLI